MLTEIHKEVVMSTLLKKLSFYVLPLTAFTALLLTQTTVHAVCPPQGSGYVIDGATVVDSEGCTISTKGKNKPGIDINANSGSVASLILGAADNANRSSITTSGNDSDGVFSRGNSTVILYHTDIITNNPSSSGLHANNENGGSPAIELHDGTITTTSNGGHGVRIRGNRENGALTTQITINNCVVNVSGPNAIGLLVENGPGNLMFNNSVITTQQNFSHGAWASSPGANIAINNSQVNTYGNGAVGAMVSGLASVSILNSTISTNDRNANVLSSAVNVGQNGAFTVANSNLNSRNAATISASGGGVTNISFDTVTNNTGNNEFLLATKSGASTVNLIANNSRLTGDTIVSGSNTVNMSLLNNTTYLGAMGALDPTSRLNVFIDPSLWTINGNSIVSNLSNQGTIIFESPHSTAGPYKPLLVQGNYLGSNGNLIVNTVLESDFSPSDLFIINGGRGQGNTNVEIINQNGEGDLTYNNGILIVKALNGATTDPNAFVALSSIEAGPFIYDLNQGGIEGSDPYSWYLRSTVFIPEPPIDVPVFPSFPIFLPIGPEHPIVLPPFGPEFPVDPPAIIPPFPGEPTFPPSGGVIQFPATPLGSPDSGFMVQIPPIPIEVANVRQVNIFGLPLGYFPNFRPIVSLYTAIPSIGLLYSQMIFDNLHRRVGEQEQLLCSSKGPQQSFANGGWIRLGSNNGRRINGTIFKRGPDFKYHNQAIQFGLDLYHDQTLHNTGNFIGIFGSLGESNASVKNIFNLEAGKVDYNNYAGGFYYTHYNSIGYFDAIAQAGHSSINSINKSRNPFLFKTHSKNWGVSLETGIPIELICNLEVEPQAQISYQKLNIKKARGLFVNVGFEHARSVLGRLGLRLKKTISQNDYLITPWLAVNVLREFQGKSYTTFSYRRGVLPIPSSLRGNSASFELGLSALIHENASLYASYNRQCIFSNKRSFNSSGHVGIRVNL